MAEHRWQGGAELADRSRPRDRRTRLGEWWRDAGYSARSLARTPGFTAAAAGILALGIGLNVTMFGVVNAFLLRPLPFPDDRRLVLLDEKGPAGTMKIAAANFVDWQERQRVFAAMAAYQRIGAVLSGEGDAERVDGVWATADLFRVLSVPPAAGRAFVAGDGEPGAPLVAVVSDGLWRRRFGGRPTLGETIVVNSRPRTVVGIMPPGFSFPERAQLWLPMPLTRDPAERAGHGLWGVARLAPARTLEHARTELADIGQQLGREYPETNANVEPVVEPLRNEFVEPELRSGLVAALAATGFVLLIACVNLANLILARGASRGRELALRVALGAGRPAIVRLLLTESLCIAALGAAGGLLLGRFGLAAAGAMLPDGAPAWIRMAIDLTVLVFVGALLVATAAAAGLVPALRASDPDLRGWCGDAGGSTGARRGDRLRRILVVVETSLAMLLLACAGLMTRAYVDLLAKDPGFRPDGVIAMRMALPARAYPSTATVNAFYSEFLVSVRALPGVRQAGAGSRVPAQQSNWGLGVVPEGSVVVSADSRGAFPASGVIATPGYFEALGIACQRGRTFSERDGLAGTPAVVIVNRHFARTHWPEGDPIGRRVKMGMGSGTPPEWRTVVGVVDDVLGAARDAPLTVYVPFEQSGHREMTIAVKASSDPLAMVAPIRQRLARLDRSLPLSNVATMEEVVDDARWMPRTLMRLFVVFGGLALALACAGIYGVLAYSVSRRTREMGIRSALGASSGQIARLVLRQGLGPAAIGMLIGLAASLGVTRLLRSLLSGVSPTDPLSYAVTALVLLAAALAACYLPARQATRVDPLVAIRGE